MQMCLSALRDEGGIGEEGVKGTGKRVKRLLLLLATKNADKAAVPAAFEHRVAMMGRFAEDLRKIFSKGGGSRAEPRGKMEQGRKSDGEDAAEATQRSRSGSSELEDLIIDIGVTKAAMFIAKAQAIEESGAYVLPLDEVGGVAEQVHLTGYDTLIRLVDTKYYPPEHTLAPLGGLFGKHRVRVTMRSPPSKEEQLEFLKRLSGSTFEVKGWKREWGQRIEMVEEKGEGEDAISSTRAREYFEDPGLRSDGAAKWCSQGVIEHVLREGQYLDDGVRQR